MSFAAQYANLETAFEEQVGKDNFDLDLDPGSKFLPSIPPEGPVDYVLIGMEPSFRGAFGEAACDDHPPKSFSGSMEDFILHFCVENYLCKGNRTYYLTCLAKGGMPIKIVTSVRNRRYRMWYPLLKRELDLVLKPNGIVIALGSLVDSFLRKQKLSRIHAKVIHHGRTVGGYRVEIPRRYPERYSAFAQTVSRTDIEDTARRVMKDAGMPLSETENTMQRLWSGSGLTESRKRLMFTYLCQFENILAANP